MKKFATTSAMFLLMGLAVPSFAARQDQKEEPHPAPARQEHQQAAHQQHQQPQQAARPERPVAQPQYQQAPPSRPARQAEAHPSQEHQAPPQTQPQRQAPTQASHQEHHVPQHPPTHPPQAIPQNPPQAQPQRTYGSHYGGTHNNYPQQHNYQGPTPQQAREWQHSHAHSWQNQHRTWVQRGGYHGYRIPEARFRVYFGRPHPFRIWGLPLRFVSGYPSFEYDNYWVTLVDPWPEFWPDDWYQVDDVYLDYTDDGYYLYDLTRGGPGIACEVAD